MATRVWTGSAQAVAQQNTVTPANVNVGNVFNVTVNGKTVSYTAAAATVADVTAGLAAAVALAASTEPEFQQLTPADQTMLLRLTGPADGAPFVQTSSASGGTATLTTATTAAGSGPNYWTAAGNWSGAAVPVAGDDVTYNGSSTVNCLYGINQSGVTLASLTVTAGYTGQIGLPARNDLGYAEYRDQFLRVGSTGAVNVGEGSGAGPSLLRLDTGAVATTLNVFAGTVDWKGTHASANAVNRVGGTLTIATAPGDAATLATLRVESAAGGTFGAAGGPADVTLGAGVTAGALTLAGGSVLSAATFASGLLEGGTLTLIDAAGFTAGPTVQSGTLNWNSTGSLNTLLIYDGGTLDVSGDLRPKTVVTSTAVYKGGAILDPNKVVTFTGGVQVSGCRLDGVKLDLGANFTLTRS